MATSDAATRPAGTGGGAQGEVPESHIAAIRAGLQVRHAEDYGDDWAKAPPALSPRAGLMVAFRAAVETLRDHALAAVLLGVVIAWMSVRAIDRARDRRLEPA